MAYDATTRHGITQGTAFGAGAYVANANDPLTLLVSPRVGTVRGPLPATRERVWAMLPAAFAANDLRINAVDSAAHAMGDSMVVHGTIGTTAVTDVIDCGTPPTGRRHWPTSRCSDAEARAERFLGTTVTSTVQAVAWPSGAPIRHPRCSNDGAAALCLTCLADELI
jgi:hypothetical protein